MSNHRTRQRASSPPSNDPTTDFGVSLQVREEACEAAEEARKGVGRGMHVNTSRGYREQENQAIVDAAIPVIAEAAYKAGLEEAKARIRAAINEIDWDRGLPELVVSQEQEDAFRTFRRAALAAIDKEGETNE